jgi:chorismate mutase/prephenate dehydratase
MATNDSQHQDPQSRDGGHIDHLRRTIDDIDAQILALINRRLETARIIGQTKKSQERQVVDSKREAAIIRRLVSLNSGPISERDLHHIFTEIITISRDIQQSRRVTYLGPQATFTHLAAMNHFGHFVEYIPQASIRDIFKEVERGLSAYGVVPVESSTEGAVNHTIDQFFKSSLKICAEKYQVVSHDLLSINPHLSEIKTVYSHPQAFVRCRDWLKMHLPKVKLEECSSTGTAAHKAAVSSSCAAIASRESASIYNLNVLATKIEDKAGMKARFLVIGKTDSPPTGNDKTSILFSLINTPGALHRALKPLETARINILRLETRAAGHSGFEDLFLVDLQGHIKDRSLKAAADEMRLLCRYFKLLGSYPHSV